MILEIKIPSPGESITEVEIASWLVEDGDYVEKDQELAEVESDKATLPLLAEDSGKISLKASEGETLNVGAVACTIDTSAQGGKTEEKKSGGKEEEAKTEEATKKEPEPQPENTEKTKKESADKEEKSVDKKQTAEEKTEKETKAPPAEEYKEVKVSPLARKRMEEEGLDVEDIINGLRRITRGDVEAVVSHKAEEPSQPSGEVSRETNRKRMSNLRRKLAQRLVAVKNDTAMLTTFNEADMSAIMQLRQKFQKKFTDKHGIKLGFMSFFTKAVTIALQQFPNVNSMIDGEEIVSPEYVDVGIAVQTGKGLMVPVLRNTEHMGLADIEKEILRLAEKARNNRLGIEEMTGGTFTITNGGIFGSMLSTPIINPPQSAILGMHNIIERPVAINGKVEIRPMMYLALSYDHRLIDGRDSVSFLVKVKELLEDPYKMLLNGANADEKLLGI